MKDCKLFGRRHSPFTGLVESYIYIARLHRTVLERQLNKTGVYRSQHQLLMHIADNPNASQKELARIQNVSTAAVAVTLKKLEKGGYVGRIVDRDDNRYNKIRITEKGRKEVERSIDLFKRVEKGMFAGFSSEEKECFYSCLQKLSGNLEQMLQQAKKEDWN